MAHQRNELTLWEKLDMLVVLPGGKNLVVGQCWEDEMLNLL
jgi:hypothetical protein